MKTIVQTFIVYIALLCLDFSVISGQMMPSASPEEAGLSSERLSHLTNTMQNYIDDNQIAGCVMLIARRGKIVYCKALGMANIEDGRKMRTDDIFRIASMTKPITSAAVMMLYEEGKILLSEPVSKYIPEFKNSKVYVPSETVGTYSIVPAKREITIRHLLNHTSGIVYPSNEGVGKLYSDAGLRRMMGNDSGLEIMKVLAGMPLAHHPGEAWQYGLNTDLLGVLIEIWSGKTLDEFLREKIFEPLGMRDTYFIITPEKASKLVTIYTRGDEGRMKPVPHTAPLDGPRKFYSGGGGLCSTAEDYARFLQMMLNKGKLNGARILSRKTVELMTTNSIGDLSILEGNILGGRNFKFGLGFSVRKGVDEGSELESAGNFGWGGAFYTHTFVDPSEEMVGIFMAQLQLANERMYTKFVNLATQAVSD